MKCWFACAVHIVRQRPAHLSRQADDADADDTRPRDHRRRRRHRRRWKVRPATVEPLVVGDRVTWSIAGHCGRCLHASTNAAEVRAAVQVRSREAERTPDPQRRARRVLASLTADTPIFVIFPIRLERRRGVHRQLCDGHGRRGASHRRRLPGRAASLVLGAGMLGLNADGDGE